VRRPQILQSTSSPPLSPATTPSPVVLLPCLRHRPLWICSLTLHLRICPCVLTRLCRRPVGKMTTPPVGVPALPVEAARFLLLNFVGGLEDGYDWRERGGHELALLHYLDAVLPGDR
jgi:hypothetical protein